MIFFKLQLDQEGIQNVNGVIYLCVLSCTFGPLFGIVEVKCSTKTHAKCHSKAATHFNCIDYFSFCFFLLQKFPKELPVFLRDTQNKLYVPCLRSLSIHLH